MQWMASGTIEYQVHHRISATCQIQIGGVCRLAHGTKQRDMTSGRLVKLPRHATGDMLGFGKLALAPPEASQVLEAL